MVKYKFKNIFFFLLYLKILYISCLLNSPNAPQYVSFQQNIIKIKADIITDAIYKFTYSIDSNEQTLDTNQYEIELDCEKGKQILIYYKYSTNNDDSSNSPSSFFFCATIPSLVNQNNVNILTTTSNSVYLSWDPPDDDGGSSILGYVIKLKKTSPQESDLTIVYDEISCPNTYISINELESGCSYDIFIYPVNLIVRLFNTSFLSQEGNAAKKSIYIKKRANSQNCILSGSGLANFTSTTSSVEIKLVSNDCNDQTIPSCESIFMLQIQDLCTFKNNNKFVCEKSLNENNEYIFESVEDYIIKMFKKIGNGEYKVDYSILGNGILTINVYQLIQGGILGQYYNNIWFLEPFIEEKIDYKFDFNWDENTNIINNLNDFISIRWIGALLSPENNVFTFSISSDDGIRIFINHKNVLDHLNSPCDDCNFSYNMKENEYYWIKIEFVQLQGPCRFKLYWQSSSRPQEIIPSEFLFYPEIVGNSPYNIEISLGNIHPSKCYVEKNEKTVFVGKLSKFNIIPVNINDKRITSIDSSNNIIFDINIINKDSNNIKGNLYFQSKLDNTDISNPFFYGEFIPLIPGEYTVNIKYGNVHIKNSPYNLTIIHGEISPIYSKIINNLENLSQKAGLITRLKLQLYDIMKNEYKAEPDYFPVNIKFLAKWVESQTIEQNKCGNEQGISDDNTLEKIYAGNAKSNNNGTYELTISPLKIGKYELYIYINEQKIDNCPFNLDVLPSILDPSKCVYNTNKFSTNTFIAGQDIEIYYQCRDTYGNNIKTLIDNNNDILKELYIISNENTNDVIKFEGNINDYNEQNGCYLAKFKPTKIGKYKTIILLNDLLIPPIEISINPSTPSKVESYVEIIDKKNKYYAGDSIKIKIICLDEFKNLIVEEKTFSIIINDDSTKIYNPTYEKNGIYTFSYQLTTIDTYKFNVLYEQNDIKDSPIENIILYPTKPSEKSKITDIQYTLSFKAGETITLIKALLKDKYDNIIEDQENEIVFLDFMDKNNISNNYLFKGKYSKSSDNYNYYFDDIIITKNANYSISLNIIDNFGLIGYYYQSVDFYNLFNPQNRNYHSSIKNNLDNYYTKIDVEINFSPGYLSFIEGFPFELISIEWKGYIKSDTSEIYTIYLDVFGKAVLYLDNEIVINYSSSIYEKNNENDNYTPNYVNLYLKKDEYIPLKLIYIKQKDIILSKIIMSWESDTIQKQVIPQNNLYSSIFSIEEKFINIKTAKVDIESLEIINMNSLSNCNLDNTNNYYFNFRIYDIYGNIIDENRINVEININCYLINAKDLSKINCVISFENNVNLYKVSCTINNEGNYNLEIEVNFITEGLSKLYNNYEVLSCSKNPDLSLCNNYKIEGDRLSNGVLSSISGEKTNFTLAFYDQSNQNIIYSCENVLFSATINSINPGANYINPSPILMKYNSSSESVNYGKFILSFTAYTVLTSNYKIKIHFNNLNLQNTDDEIELRLSPGKPSNIHSIYKSTISNEILMKTNFNYDIEIYDSYSNVINDQNFKIYSEIKGMFGFYKKMLTKETDSSLYKAEFNIQRINDTFSGCGVGILSSYILKKGIKINYFNNYFVNGNPFKTDINENGKIELNLGENDLLGNIYDKLYTSIQYIFYFQPESNEFYHFLIYTNKNNIRLYFDEELVIDSFDQPLLTQYSFYTSKKLENNLVYSFRLNIYIRESKVQISMYYYTDSIPIKLIESTNGNIFYSDLSPIDDQKKNLNFYSYPGKIENIYQDLTTNNGNSITIKWERPNDNGCDKIIKYIIYHYNPDKQFSFILNESDLNKNILSYTINNDPNDFTIEVNKEYRFKIAGFNSKTNDLIISDEIICKLINYPLSNLIFSKLTNDENILEIKWNAISDTSIQDITYHLEYCELSLDSNETFVEIYSGTQNNYQMNVITKNLIYGNNYKFRVYAETQLGKGEYLEKNYIHSGKPGKPPSPPIIDISKTTERHLEFTFEPIIQNNGSPIKKYYLYINGDEREVNNINDFRYVYETTNSDAYTPIIVRYLAENDNGKGPLSDPSSPMYAAEKPGHPIDLKKVTSSSTKGIITISWKAPSSNGGASILGYKIYLNDIYMTSVQSNIYKFTFQNVFEINIKNKISVSAYNIMGEGEKTEIEDIDSTGVPGKIDIIKLISHDRNSLNIEWEEPNDNGGLRILNYDIRINDGSEIGKNFGTEETNIIIRTKQFNGLDSSKYYSIQIRANNYNGNGEWSNYATFFTGLPPGQVNNFEWDKNSSDQNKIILKWEPPYDNGGCDIYGYKIYNSGQNLLYNGPELFFIFDNKYNIIPSNYYYFEIYAYNCAYQSIISNSVSAYSAKAPDKMNPIIFNKYISDTSFSIIIDNSINDGGLPITNYILYLNCENCNTASLTKNIEISNLNDNIITIQDNNLEKGKQYKIQIAAQNIVDIGEKSNEVEIEFINIPSFPQNFNFGVKYENKEFDVKWQRIDNNDNIKIGYRIYLSDNYIDNNNLNNYTLIYDTFKQSGILHYTLNETKLNLIESKLYHICLTAYNSAGETEPIYSNFYYGKYPPTPSEFILLDIIENLETINGQIVIKSFTIRLQFKLNINNNSLPIKYYKLYSKIEENEEIKQLNQISHDINNVNIMIIQNEIFSNAYELGKKVIYKLKAVNDIGEGEYSNPLEVIYSKYPNKPGDISIKKRLTKDSLTLNWKTETIIPNNIETLGYAIYLDTEIFFDTSIITISNEYTLTNLIPGQKYNISIKTINKLGESKEGSFFCFIAGLIPSEIINIRRNYNLLDINKVSILFDPPKDNGGCDITNYIIKIIKEDNTEIDKNIDVSQIILSGSLYYTFEGNDLINNIVTFYIKAKNDVGIGPEEKYIYSFVGGKFPGIPKNFQISEIIPLYINDLDDNNKYYCNVYVKWESPTDNGGTDIYKYQILISKNDNNEYEILDNDISPFLINNYLIKNLIIGHNYQLQISGFNAIGQGEIYYTSLYISLKPSPPLNLEIIAHKNGQISLSWEKPLYENGKKIQEYIIYYEAIRNEGDNSGIDTNSPKNTQNILNSYDLTISDQIHQYKIWVKAKNEKGESDKSNIVYGYAISSPVIETKPTIDDNSRTTTSFKIQWNNNQYNSGNSPPLTGYEVYIRDLNETFLDYKLIYDGKYIDNILEITVNGLINGHYYGIIYYAYNKAGRSNMSPELIVLCAIKPSAPNGVILKSVSNSEIVITWDYSDLFNSNLVLIKGFNIYNENENTPIICQFDNTNIGNDITNRMVPAKYNSCKIIPSSNDIVNLRITALNEIGESEKSNNVLKVKPIDLPNRPILNLKYFDKDFCELSWEPNSTLEIQKNFILYFKENNDLIKLYEGNLNSYKHENLSPLKTYIYLVSEVNDGGESEKSSEIECITYPLSSPPEKINLIESSPNKIIVRLTPPSELYSPIKYYNVYIKEPNSINVKYIQKCNTLTCEINTIENTLISLKVYEFYATAIDYYNRESDKTSIEQFYFASIPIKISNVNVEVIENKKTKINWSFSNSNNLSNQLPILYFNLYYKDNYIQNNDYKIIKVADELNNYYVLENLIYGHTYSFFVSAINAVGEGEKSDEILKKCIYPPDPPDIFYIKNIELLSSENPDNKCTVTFSWEYTKNLNKEENKAIIKYKLEVYKLNSNKEKESETPTFIIIVDKTNSPSLNMIEDNNFIKDNFYEIHIKSINEIESNGYNLIIKQIILKPSQVINIKEKENSRTRTSIGIEWDDQSNEKVIFYTIYILSYNNENSNSDNKFLISYKNEYYFSNLEKGKNLIIQIEAVNEIGTGPKSDIKTFEIYGLPDSPTNIYLSSISKDKITINFSPSNENGGSPITSYNIYRSEDSTFLYKIKIQTFSVNNDNNIEILSYINTELSPCKNHYYTVTSVNILGESEINEKSYIVNATTEIEPSYYDSNLMITKIGNNSFYINWNEIDETNNGGCKSDILYTLYMKAIETNSEYIKIFSGRELYYTIENLDLWKKYIFKLVVSNSIGSIDICEKESSDYTGYLINPPQNIQLINRKIYRTNSFTGSGQTMEEEHDVSRRNLDEATNIVISVKIKWDSINYDSSFINYKICYSNSINNINENNCQYNSSINKNEFELTNKIFDSLREEDYIYFSISIINSIGEGPKSTPLRILVGQIPLSPQKELIYFLHLKSKSITLQIPDLPELGDIYGNIIPSRYIIKMNDSIIINSTNKINEVAGLQLGNIYIFTYALSNIIYEQDNVLKESLNFGGETIIQLLTSPDQVKNLRFNENKNELYSDKVIIEWDKINNDNDIPLLNYIIYQECLSCTSNNNKNIIVSADLTEILIEELIPGEKYSFYITGKNQKDLEGEKSNIIIFTAGLRPKKMSIPNLESLTLSKMTIKNNVNLSNVETGGNDNHKLDIINYNLYKNGYKYFETGDKDKIEEYTFSNLIKGEEYYIQISCVNIIGESDLSDKLIVIPSYYPSSPLNLKIERQSSSKIELSWKEPLDNGGLPMTSYEINIEDNNGLIKKEEISDTSFSFTEGIEAGKEYNFKVRAINKYANEKREENKYKWSEIKKGYSMNIPSSVQNLQINDYDRYKGKLTWTSLSTEIEKGYSNNIEYILYIRYNNNNNFKEILNTLNSNDNNNNYVFQVPVLGIKYYFKIITKNEVGSGESDEIKILFNSKPQKMKTLHLESLSVYSSDTSFIKLSWAEDKTNDDIIDELLNYKIEIKRENNENIIKIYEINNIDIKTITIPQNEEDNQILIPGEIYYFFISVNNNRGYSDNSDGLKVLFAEPPQNITLIKKNICPNFIELIWSIENIQNGGSEITGFIIQSKLSTNSNYDNYNYTIGSSTEFPSNIIITNKQNILDFLDCSITPQTQESTAQILTNFFSIRFYTLSKGFYYNFRIAAYNKFFNNIENIKFMEPLCILFATKPGKINIFEQVLENLKENQINLKWEPPNDNGGAEILNYIIAQKIGDNIYNLPNIPKDINYYEIKGVENDNLIYIIKSQNEIGISEESNEIICHPGLRPGKVQDLRTTIVKKNEITIRFNEPLNKNLLNCQIGEYIFSYKIGESNEIIENINTNQIINNDYYEKKLDSNKFKINDNNYYPEGTKIIFKVKAVNSVGEGETTELITYNCDNPSVPNFSIYKREENGIIFSLKPNENDLNLMKNNNNCRLTKLEVYKDNDIVCNDSYRKVKCSINNLENGNTYNFKLLYYNNVGGSSEKAIQNCKIGVIPNKITNFIIDKIIISDNNNNNQLDISWNKDDSNKNLVTKYYVLYSLQSGSFPKINDDYKTELTYKNLTGLTKNETYKIKVYAINDIGSGAEVELLYVIIDSPPKIIKMEVKETNCNSVIIKWETEVSQNYPIEKYYIYANGTKYEKDNNNNNDKEYNIENLETGKNYQINITAKYKFGQSNTISKSIKICQPKALDNINIILTKVNEDENDKNYNIEIEWEYNIINDCICYCEIKKEIIEIYKSDNDIDESNKLDNEEVFIHSYNKQKDLSGVDKVTVIIKAYDENDIISIYKKTTDVH